MAARKKKPVDETTVNKPVESGAEVATEAITDETTDKAAVAETVEATARAVVPTDEPAADAKPVKAPAKKTVQSDVASAQALAFPYNRTLKYGADGEDVRTLQNALLSSGHDVTASGVYDLRTVRAVQQLQRHKGQPASGIIGKYDYAALLGGD